MGVTSSEWVVCKGDYSAAEDEAQPVLRQCAGRIARAAQRLASSRSDRWRLKTAADAGQQFGERHGGVVLEAWPDDLQADR
jgi:hypothetical protein